MNNQYFGDNRDLFKYDLIYQIIDAKSAVLPKRFTFIPMLTKDEKPKEGKPGTKNKPLICFLNDCLQSERRDIRELKNFHKFKGKIRIYKDGEYFCHNNRKEYFREIKKDRYLSKSLILVDPDTGLEPDGKTEKEHVKYCEVKSLYDRMDKSSILMIFQDLSRKKRDEYLDQISARIKNEVRTEQPIYIHDGKTLFFFLTKENKSLRKSLSNILSDYKGSYPKLEIGSAK